MTTESQNDEWEALQRSLGYPKRMVVDPRNKNRDAAQAFFDKQYLDECKRLGIEPEPEQKPLL